MVNWLKINCTIWYLRSSGPHILKFSVHMHLQPPSSFRIWNKNCSRINPTFHTHHPPHLPRRRYYYYYYSTPREWKKERKYIKNVSRPRVSDDVHDNGGPKWVSKWWRSEDNEFHQNHPKHRAKFHASGAQIYGWKIKTWFTSINQSYYMVGLTCRFCV